LVEKRFSFLIKLINQVILPSIGNYQIPILAFQFLNPWFIIIHRLFDVFGCFCGWRNISE